jgi:hypothetical protein
VLEQFTASAMSADARFLGSVALAGKPVELLAERAQ